MCQCPTTAGGSPSRCPNLHVLKIWSPAGNVSQKLCFGHDGCCSPIFRRGYHRRPLVLPTRHFLVCPGHRRAIDDGECYRCRLQHRRRRVRCGPRNFYQRYFRVRRQGARGLSRPCRSVTRLGEDGRSYTRAYFSLSSRVKPFSPPVAPLFCLRVRSCVWAHGSCSGGGTTTSPRCSLSATRPSCG